MSYLRILLTSVAGAAAVFVLAGAPAPAAAATYTFTGKLASGFDGRGLFGAAGADLAGLDFTYVFTRDDALAPPGGIALDPTGSDIYGEGANTPVSASATINGVTVAIGGQNGEQNQYDNGIDQGFDFTVTSLDSRIELAAYQRSDLPRAFDLRPDYHGLPSLTAAQHPELRWFGDLTFLGDNQVDTQAYFDPATLRLSVDGGGLPAGVPEPASWALMILGAGLAGAHLRHRRTALAA